MKYLRCAGEFACDLCKQQGSQKEIGPKTLHFDSSQRCDPSVIIFATIGFCVNYEQTYVWRLKVNIFLYD